MKRRVLAPPEDEPEPKKLLFRSKRAREELFTHSSSKLKERALKWIKSCDPSLTSNKLLFGKLRCPQAFVVIEALSYNAGEYYEAEGLEEEYERDVALCGDVCDLNMLHAIALLLDDDKAKNEKELLKDEYHRSYTLAILLDILKARLSLLDVNPGALLKRLFQLAAYYGYTDGDGIQPDKQHQAIISVFYFTNLHFLLQPPSLATENLFLGAQSFHEIVIGNGLECTLEHTTSMMNNVLLDWSQSLFVIREFQ
jgi:hypothetical protein